MAEPLSRRQFLSGGVGRALHEGARAVADRVAPEMYVRPPGALPEAELLTACTRCGDCVPACPHGAVTLLDTNAGLAAGTPVITPRVSPCLMCDGFPCVTACEPMALLIGAGTLEPRNPGTPEVLVGEAGDEVRAFDRIPIGVAEVDAGRCWSAQGQVCDYCAGECNRHVRAIVLEPGAPPRVDGSRCDGCGRCEYICPVTGQAAITVSPLRDRR